MTYLIKMVPEHVWHPDGSKLQGEIPAAGTARSYLHQLELPHFLNSQPGLGLVTAGHVSMIIPSDMELSIQDEVVNEYGWRALVADIIERRPAKGNWPERKRPDFVEVAYI